MYYSYYFDIEKKHRLNFGFNMLSTSEAGDGTITAQFTAYVEEINDSKVIKREAKNSQFVFPGSLRNDEDESDYDIDFLRERFADTNKWIFNVKNNRNTAQSLMIGIITDLITTNPLGCEIIYEEEAFTGDLKAGNLSRLDSQYVEPILRQTITQITFDSGGLPDEIIMPDSGEYMNGYKLYRTTRFNVPFKKPIDDGTVFGLEINIAPETYEAQTGTAIFDLILEGIGTFTLNKTTASFIGNGLTSTDRVTVSLREPLTNTFFFNSGLKNSSKFIAKADKKGNISLQYAEILINAKFNPTKEFTGITFEGKVAKGTSNRIVAKVDNIIAYYEK